MSKQYAIRCLGRISRFLAAGPRPGAGGAPILAESAPGLEEFQRLPGLFCRWDLSEVLTAGRFYFIDDAGDAADGTQLFMVYRAEADGGES